MATGSGTGTPATIPHQVTAVSLIDDAIRPALDDVGESVFSDAELLSWLNEAIKEYTQHLPRLSTESIAAITNVRTYALPWDTLNVHSVEFPADEIPPVYIKQMSYKRPMQFNNRCYDFLPRLDLTTSPTILLNFDPVTGDIIRVSYQHPHDSELTADDYITVPADHHHVLVQYVLFTASRQLQANEEAAPTSSSSLLMSQYASNTRRYELAYLNALNRILFHRRGRSEMSVWTMDSFDRTY